jgi:hypothetical protein
MSDERKAWCDAIKDVLEAVLTWALAWCGVKG